MERLNYNDKLLDLISFKLDVNSLEETMNQIEDKNLMTEFIGLLEINGLSVEFYEKLLKCLFQVIRYIDINAFDNILLISACEYGHLEIIKYLLENSTYSNDELTLALEYSLECRHLEVIKCLLENNNSLHLEDYEVTLRWATNCDYQEIIECIKKQITFDENEQMFQYFRKFNKVINLSRFYFNQMEKLNYSDKLLDSIYSRQDIDSLSKVIHLVENKSLVSQFINLIEIWKIESRKKLLGCIFQVIDDINISSFDNILLIYSCKYGNLEFVKCLIERGVDLHYALECAVYENHLNIIKLLIENGAYLHFNDESALKCAVINGNLEIIKYLIENGADLHSSEDYVLRCASYNGNLEVVKYLVENGANVHTKDDEVLRLAIYYRHPEIIEYLKKHI